MHKRQPLPWSSTLIATVISILLAAIAAIIGNSAVSLPIRTWDYVSTSIKMNLWLWFIILTATLLICLGIFFYLLLRNRALSQALTEANNLIQSDDTLLSLLASSVPTKGYETEVKRLLAELLRDAVRGFNGEVHRASILLPDTIGEHLKVWAHYPISEDSIARTRFYIGPDENRKGEQGVAGESFSSREMLIAHVEIEKDHYKCDKSSFLEFVDPPPSVPYRSFICVPIIGPTPSGNNVVTCLGVACFDSTNSTAFDSSSSQTVLRLFVRRIAAALLIYRQLSVLRYGSI